MSDIPLYGVYIQYIVAIAAIIRKCQSDISPQKCWRTPVHTHNVILEHVIEIYLAYETSFSHLRKREWHMNIHNNIINIHIFISIFTCDVIELISKRVIFSPICLFFWKTKTFSLRTHNHDNHNDNNRNNNGKAARANQQHISLSFIAHIILYIYPSTWKRLCALLCTSIYEP